MQDVDARLRGGDLLGDLSGSVGRGVVDDEDLEAGVLRQNGWDQSGEVLALIVRRNHDEGPKHGQTMASGA
jgi:hypothetical protein